MQLAEQGPARTGIWSRLPREFTVAAELSDDVALVERATQFTLAVGFDALAERAAGAGVSLRRTTRWRMRSWDVCSCGGMPSMPLSPVSELALGDRASRAATRSIWRWPVIWPAEDDAQLVTRLLSRLAALDPLAPGLQLALGTAALRSGNFELALAAAERAAQDDPGWTEPQLLIARALIAAGRMRRGLERAVPWRPKTTSPLIELALCPDARRCGQDRRGARQA